MVPIPACAGRKGYAMLLRQDFNRRHSPNRRKTRVGAILDTEGGRLGADILDVSYDGMKLAVALAMTPGTPIMIETMGARIPAIVHWCRGGLIGIRLLERLDREVLIALETADDDLADFR